jgi:SPP1 gp7 family putative phage head morphogenesis protein
MREFRSGDRWEDLADAIGKQFDVSENRARLIGRDQTSKLNGQLTEERQTNLGIEEYIWSNSQDERVRGNPDGVYPDASPSHWEMEGMICRWDDPSVYREPDSGPDDWQPRSNIDGPEEHPGEPIICRCVALPNLDPLLEQLPGGADLVEQNATPDAGAEE